MSGSVISRIVRTRRRTRDPRRLLQIGRDLQQPCRDEPQPIREPDDRIPSQTEKSVVRSGARGFTKRKTQKKASPARSRDRASTEDR